MPRVSEGQLPAARQVSEDGRWVWDGGNWTPSSSTPATPAVYPGAQPIGAPERIVMTLGNISVTGSRIITPTGNYPLAGSVWDVSNNTTTTRAIPTSAIVMCVLTIWICFLGLLFLAMKEERTAGYMQVTVRGAGLHQSVQVPVASLAGALAIEQQINYIRSLVATAPAVSG